MDGEEGFEEIRELLQLGVINTPVVLINGALKIQGSIPTSVIKQEVELLLSSGPVH
jgi:predicted DsbA family dithiol-disulfide isomerase